MTPHNAVVLDLKTVLLFPPDDVGAQEPFSRFWLEAHFFAINGDDDMVEGALDNFSC